MVKSRRRVRRRRKHPPIVMAPSSPVAWSPARPGPLADGAASPGHARLAPGPRRLRQPHCTPLRLLAADRVPLAGPVRPPPPREPRGPQLPARAPAPPDLDGRQLRAVKAVRERYPRWGKDKLAVLLRRTGMPALDLHGRPHPRPAPAHRGAARAAPAAGQRPAAALDSARGPSARRPTGRRASGRPGPARHPRHPAAPRPRLKQFTARDVVSRWDTLELRRRATAAAAASILDASPSGCPSPSGPSASTTAPSSWPGSRPPARPGPSACSSCHPARPSSMARWSGPTAPTPRSSTRSPTPSPTSAAFQVGAPGVGDGLQHVRPHQALGYLTPAEYLASVGIDV